MDYYYSAEKGNKEPVVEHGNALGKKSYGRFGITCSATSLLLTLTQEPQKSVFVPVLQVTKAN